MQEDETKNSNGADLKKLMEIIEDWQEILALYYAARREVDKDSEEEHHAEQEMDMFAEPAPQLPWDLIEEWR
jgi:hypothetical protein